MTQPPPRRTFSAPIGSDYATWQALVGNEMISRVSRKVAVQVPAVKRARDIFCSLGTLPLHAINGAGEQVDHKLLEQPESLKGFTKSFTISKTIEDLFYESRCLWLVVQRDSTTDFPNVVEHIEFGKWSQDEAGTVYVNGREIKDTREIILFASSDDPILVAGASMIRVLRRLELTASMYADSPELAEYFTPTEGQDPDDTEIEEFLSDWQRNRQARTTGFIPSDIERREIKRMTGEELQLVQAREFAISEVSRLTGISPNWLALNITSRTYNNAQDERRDFLDTSLAGTYLAAIEERLSLGDCTPRGQYVKFNLDAYLRANTKDRYESYSIALDKGFLTLDEVRELEDRSPLGGTPNA
jgi:hypothetical protein